MKNNSEKIKVKIYDQIPILGFNKISDLGQKSNAVIKINIHTFQKISIGQKKP